MSVSVLTVHTPLPVFYYKEFLKTQKKLKEVGETVSRGVSLREGCFFLSFNEKFNL